MNLRFALSSLLVGASLAGVYACGSSTAASEAAGGNCPDIGSRACPNDDNPVTQDTFNECKAALAGSCGAQYKALLECVGTNNNCGSDGKSDTSASTACSGQSNAYAECDIGAVDSGVVSVTTDASTTTTGDAS